MSFTPNTIVHLLKVPLNNDGANTFTFSDRTAQFNYFMSKRVESLDSSRFTYQRKDGIMRVNAVAEELWGINYVMYQHHNFGDKWFYAFATIEYVNPSVTNIRLQTDYWQTFLFDFSFGTCRIDREIVKKSNDKLFNYHLPEPVGFTHYSLDPVRSGTYQPRDFAVGGWVVASQVNLQTSPAKRSGGNTYNGTYYPLSMYLTRGNDNVQAIIEAINACYDNGVNYIQAIPKFASDALKTTEVVDGSNTGIISTRDYVTTKRFNLNLSVQLDNDILDGYNVRNRKCFNYTSLIASSNGGTGHEYDLGEWFGVSTEEHDYEIEFMAYTNINEGCNVSFVPFGYKMSTEDDLNYDEGFISQTYPTMGYIIEKSNYFQYQQEIQAGRIEASSWGAGAQAVGSAIGTGLTLGLAGASTGASTGFLSASTANLSSGMTGTTAGMQGASAGAGQLGQNVAISLDLLRQGNEFDRMRQEQYLSTPYQFGGIAGSTSTAVVAGYIEPHFYFKAPLHDEVRAIDTFFDMFGYCVNRNGVPNFRSPRRQKWDYYKCSKVTFDEQNLPQEAVEHIRSCMEGGMTFWHNPQTNTPYDYSQSNPDAS